MWSRGFATTCCLLIDPHMNAIPPKQPESSPADHHTGRLDLEFSTDQAGRTYLDRQYSRYPFHICRPHYLDKELPEMATLYTQSCAGGIFRDDHLSIDVVANSDTSVHLTTQASTVVHSMEEGEASQTMTIVAKNNSLVEYIPDPTILFPNAKFTSTIGVQVSDDAEMILGDSFLTHDPGQSSDPFGYLASELRIADETGNIVALDRFHVKGREFMNRRVGTMGEHVAHGTMVVIAPRECLADLQQNLAHATAKIDSVYAGVSCLPGGRGVWLRYTAIDGVALTSTMQMAWKIARHSLTGQEPQSRRK